MGGMYGGPAGAVLGFLAGLVIAIATTIRPPHSREGYIVFVRTTCSAIPVAYASFLAVVADFSELGGAVTWLLFVVPGVIGSLVAWFLAPRAVRKYLDTVLPEGPP